MENIHEAAGKEIGKRKAKSDKGIERVDSCIKWKQKERKGVSYKPTCLIEENLNMFLLLLKIKSENKRSLYM